MTNKQGAASELEATAELDAETKAKAKAKTARWQRGELEIDGEKRRARTLQHMAILDDGRIVERCAVRDADGAPTGAERCVVWPGDGDVERATRRVEAWLGL